VVCSDSTGSIFPRRLPSLPYLGKILSNYRHQSFNTVSAVGHSRVIKLLATIIGYLIFQTTIGMPGMRFYIEKYLEQKNTAEQKIKF
jgi:hypothetical protein